MRYEFKKIDLSFVSGSPKKSPFVMSLYSHTSYNKETEYIQFFLMVWVFVFTAPEKMNLL